METLIDTKLCLKLDLQRIRIKEIDLAQFLYNEVAELNCENNDICGVQVLWRKGLSWAIIFCLNERVRAIVLAANQFTLEGNLVSVMPYTPDAYKQAERISIHGIPFHVSNNEVSQWVEKFVRITSPVQYAIKQRNGVRINTGNRFCYGTVKDDCIFPRYHEITIESPFNSTALIDIDVTVYIDSQVVNCARCKELSHVSRDCPLNRANQQTYTAKDPAKEQGSQNVGESNDNDKIIDGGLARPSTSQTNSQPTNPLVNNKTNQDAPQPVTKNTPSANIKPDTNITQKAGSVNNVKEQTKEGSRKNRTLTDSKITPARINTSRSEKRPPVFTPPSTERPSKIEKKKDNFKT